MFSVFATGKSSFLFVYQKNKIKRKNEKAIFNAYVVHAIGNIRTEVRSRKRTGDHGFYA